jgi:hypothetical protein
MKMKRKRTKTIKVRLTEDELKSLNEKVKLTGLSRENYIRALIEGHDIKALPPDTFHSVIFHLRHIGSNLNQIARVANTTGEIDTQQYKENVKCLNKEILEIRKKMIE